MRTQAETTGGKSLQRRLCNWIIATILTAIALLTVAGLHEERRTVLAVQVAYGQSLLRHLAEMPALAAGLRDAKREIAHLDSLAGSSGIVVELVEAGTPVREGTLATTSIVLPEGSYDLRYRTDVPWRAMVGRTVISHVLVGILALIVLLGGTMLILRSRLVVPLRRIVHQIRFMRAGGGWSPKLPKADDELRDLEAALLELGPGLHGQVQQWIEAERRAAATRAISKLRARLRQPHRCAVAGLGDLLARGLVAAEGRGRVRNISRELDRLSAEIEQEERELLLLQRPPAGPEPSTPN